MASVLLGIDDESVSGELAEGLRGAGHAVKVVGPLDVSPAGWDSGTPPDVLIVDGEVSTLDLGVLGVAWRGVKPAPVIMVMAATADVRIAAERIQALVLPKPVGPAELVDEVAQATGGPRRDAGPTAAAALRVLGLAIGGDPEDEAATILARYRQVPVEVVREALRPHMHQYVTATPRLEALCGRRALGETEGRFAMAMDGAHTIRRVIDGGGMEQTAAGRLVWALVSGGAVALTPEPPGIPERPRARRVAWARAHLRARRQRTHKASPFDVLELERDAPTAEVERATQALSLRFAPERLAVLDLGELAKLVTPLWQQILQARALLVDPRERERYVAFRPDDPAARVRRQADVKEADAAFVRGQQALAQGDAFRSVSELAAAARRLPTEPDYEIYAAWARCCADEARGGDRAASARRQLPDAHAALAGRRPRPRGLFALGLLAEAAGDHDAAIAYLGDALACEPRLTAARQMLQRLAGG